MSSSLILEKKGDIGDLIQLGKYNKIRKDSLIEALEEGEPCKGYILVANIDTENNSYTEGKYFFNKEDELEFEECEIKMTVSSIDKNKKKTFSQKEKLDLLCEYMNKTHKFPDEDVVYKECPIGKFAITAHRWGDICKVINEVKDEIA